MFGHGRSQRIRTTTLMRYNVALPNRTAAWMKAAVGPTLATISGIAIIASFIWYVGTPSYSYYYEEPPFRGPLTWGFWVIGVLLASAIIGIMLANMKFARQYSHYYKRVYQGRIVGKYITGGGLSSNSYSIVLEGYTLANEKRE